MEFRITEEKRRELIQKGKFLVTQVNSETINSLIAWIVNNRPEKNRFTILINSSGGAAGMVLHAASVFATLDPEVQIKGVAFGECGSAALTLLQCCHERIAVKHCGFFIHHVNLNLKMNCHGQNLKAIASDLKAAQDLEDELVQLQCARSGLSRKQWMRLADAGSQDGADPIAPSKALELGLIDKIVNHYQVF